MRRMGMMGMADSVFWRRRDKNEDDGGLQNNMSIPGALLFRANGKYELHRHTTGLYSYTWIF
jgi:hypothetical protein